MPHTLLTIKINMFQLTLFQRVYQVLKYILKEVLLKGPRDILLVKMKDSFLIIVLACVCMLTVWSSVHGISQARTLEWVAISFSRGSSWPRDETCVSCIGRQILYHWATREAHSSSLGYQVLVLISKCIGSLCFFKKWFLLMYSWFTMLV